MYILLIEKSHMSSRNISEITKKDRIINLPNVLIFSFGKGDFEVSAELNFLRIKKDKLYSKNNITGDKQTKGIKKK